MIQRSPKKGKRPRRTSTKKLHALYPSLAKAPSVGQRRAEILAKHKGPTLKTEEEWQRFLEECRAAWPEDEEIDNFLAWLKEARRTGRYV